MTDNIERIREILNYDPETGIFTWRAPLAKAHFKPGDRAGTLNRLGYRLITVSNARYLEHRLAWFYVHGRWPKEHIDHINRVKDDNRIANLREATVSQNLANGPCRSSLGFKGVYRKRGKFAATATRGGRTFYLGVFDTPAAAHAAYLAKARELFGEFARSA